MYEYVFRFEKLGFGMFVHFGLYSGLGKGEWAKSIYSISDEKYAKLINKFKVKKNWAKNLVSIAKAAGCKYITLTTRHHDGFSLYDTMGLNDYDAPHSPAGRDLVREFVDECNAQGVVPFFYHTLLDWYNKDFNSNFSKYLEYLRKSVEILCTQYGKIGGLWFDGSWSKPNDDWEEDLLYATIRKYQPKAMIINNTGIHECGKLGHKELDSVTFERGKPQFIDKSERPVASEMCQVIGDHWGYAKDDITFKPVTQLIEDLVSCRKFDCNFLLNVGPRIDGSIKPLDKYTLLEIGKWIKYYKNFIYNVKSSNIPVENAILLKGNDGYYYSVSHSVMSGDSNVAFGGPTSLVKIGAKIKSAVWLESGKKIKLESCNSFYSAPFSYGTSMHYRVAKLELE